jgi:hypothetical protein
LEDEMIGRYAPSVQYQGRRVGVASSTVYRIRRCLASQMSTGFQQEVNQALLEFLRSL